MDGSRVLYISSIVSMLCVAVTAVINPMIMQVTVDSVISDKPLDTNMFVKWMIHTAGGVSYLKKHIWICCVIYLSVSLVNCLLGFFRQRNSAVASENIAKKMKDRLYDHLQKLPYDYHIKAQTGDLIQRCTSDVDTIRRFLSSQVIEIVRALFFFTLSTAVMLTISVKMTMASIVFLPFLVIFSFLYFKKVKRAFKASDEKEGELSTTLQENLSGVRVVRAFGRAKFETEKFKANNDSYRDLGYNVVKLLAYYWSLSDILSIAQVGAVLIFGVFLTYSGEITLGQLMMFMSYENLLVWPLRQMGRVLSDMGKMQVALTRVYEILDTPEEKDTEGAVPHNLKGGIVFDKVCFEYDKDKPVLNNMSFTIAPGETIAVLGSTGSGKSTLMHILLRLYDYKRGSIKINGKELRDIEKKYLREKVGIVLQDPFLYSKTIRENLRMAKDNVEDKEMYEATETAAVHRVIEEFEKGYETLIGEKGVTLSGGQKQRVAIARTLIKNSEILIFDDSLSAVDTETDAKIRAALKERQKDVTTFIISQRITTLMHADRIFVMEKGELSDSGAHEELIKRDGLYARIWNIQSMLEDDFDKEVEA